MNHSTFDSPESQDTKSQLDQSRIALWHTYQFVLRHWIDLTEDYPPDWDNERAYSMFSTTAIFDDPPEGWGIAKLAQFARGRAYGEASLADNLRYLIEHFMIRVGMEEHIAPQPWDIEKGEGAKVLRKWLIEHRYTRPTNAAPQADGAEAGDE